MSFSGRGESCRSLAEVDRSLAEMGHEYTLKCFIAGAKN